MKFFDYLEMAIKSTNSIDKNVKLITAVTKKTVKEFDGDFLVKGSLYKILIPTSKRSEAQEQIKKDLKKAKIKFEERNVSGSTTPLIFLDEFKIRIAVKPKGRALNKGNEFESIFAKMMEDYINGSEENKDVFENFKKTTGIDLRKEKPLIELKGSLNQKRPITQQGEVFRIGEGGDIGKTISDIDLIFKNESRVHLSLKSGSTVTFFNSGLGKFLTEKDISDGSIDNIGGKALLKFLKIDEKLFCDSFNWFKDKKIKENVVIETVTNTSTIESFLESGAGYGYIYIHKQGSNIKIKDFRKKESLDKAFKIINYKIKYPIGKAKRVDCFIETNTFNLKMNIRNKQGGIYPTHIMCDYSFKE